MPLLAFSPHTFPAVSVAVAVLLVCIVLYPSINILSAKSRLRAQLARFPILNGSATSEEKRKAFLETAYQLYQNGYEKVSVTKPWSLPRPFDADDIT